MVILYATRDTKVGRDNVLQKCEVRVGDGLKRDIKTAKGEGVARRLRRWISMFMV